MLAACGPGADEIIPIISSSADASTPEYLEDIVLAMNLHDNGKKMTLCPLYLAKGAEKMLLQSAGISLAAVQSVNALNKFQGEILKSENDDCAQFIFNIVKHFETRKFIIVMNICCLTTHIPVYVFYTPCVCLCLSLTTMILCYSSRCPDPVER